MMRRVVVGGGTAAELWLARHHRSGVSRGAYYGNSAGTVATTEEGVTLWSLRIRHADYGYNPSTGTYRRGATVSNGYGSQSVGQAYNPKNGAYGQTQQVQCQWKLG